MLDAAKRGSFLERGFTATNLDEVAAAAGVSKMTIYSHFGSKEGLFIQVLEQVIAEGSTDTPSLDGDVDEAELVDTLMAIAVDLVETVQDPEVVGLRRVLVAEQPRHPRLASAWRRSTVVAAVGALTGFFKALRERELLADVQPQVLATQRSRCSSATRWMPRCSTHPVRVRRRMPTRRTSCRTVLAAYGSRQN